MQRNDAKGLYHHMLAIWPAANNHPPATTSEWVNYLAELPDADAQAAVTETRLACDFFPSFAEFNRAVADHRERRAIAEKPMVALPAGSVDPKVAKTLAAAARQLLGTDRNVITEKMFEEAAIEKWRERLTEASRRDRDEMRHRHQWDKTWGEIRSEYRAATGK